jgi:hypothetical protein
MGKKEELAEFLTLRKLLYFYGLIYGPLWSMYARFGSGLQWIYV